MKSKINQLLEDNGAVSPVIGVILMVAITVILAAVIGTFVLGLGGEVSQTAPQASLSVQNIDAGADEFTLKHGGSDTISFNELDIQVSVAGSSVGTYDETSSTGDGEEFSTADTLEIDLNTSTTSPSDDEVGVFLNAGTNLYTSTHTTDFASGDSYTLTFIDQPSGQIIAEKSGTV